MSDSEPDEIAPGLWRWTVPHPDWVPGAKPGSPGDWDELVGCLAWRTGEALVFIDPLAPPDAGGFWSWADGLARGTDVHVLTTLAFHRRDREAVVERYGASTSRAAAALPDGIEPKPLRGAGEVAFWIEPIATLVFGDRILGDGEGGLRLCPPSWLGYLEVGVDELRELVRPLLELPIERVVVSHGEPVLRGGHEALSKALA